MSPPGLRAKANLPLALFRTLIQARHAANEATIDIAEAHISSVPRETSQAGFYRYCRGTVFCATCFLPDRKGELKGELIIAVLGIVFGK